MYTLFSKPKHHTFIKCVSCHISIRPTYPFQCVALVSTFYQINRIIHYNGHCFIDFVSIYKCILYTTVRNSLNTMIYKVFGVIVFWQHYVSSHTLNTNGTISTNVCRFTEINFGDLYWQSMTFRNLIRLFWLALELNRCLFDVCVSVFFF